MPETELDRRLRAALAHPVEPAPSPARLASLRTVLPARRARRRLAVGAAAAVAALGVVVGIVVPGTGGPPSSLTLGRGASSGPACVEIVVGSARAGCAGQVVVAQPANAAAAPSAAASATGRSAGVSQPEAPPAFAAQGGRVVVVSLPRLTGVTWTVVVVAPAGGAGVSGTRSVGVRVGGDGRSEADLGLLADGRYSLSASATRRCPGGPGCRSGTVEWSAEVTVG